MQEREAKLETNSALNAYPSSLTDSALNKSSLRESTVHSCFHGNKEEAVLAAVADLIFSFLGVDETKSD